MKFDKKKFAEQLEQAKGNRSINEYARECGISAAHISRLLRLSEWSFRATFSFATIKKGSIYSPHKLNTGFNKCPTSHENKLPKAFVCRKKRLFRPLLVSSIKTLFFFLLLDILDKFYGVFVTSPAPEQVPAWCGCGN